MKRLAIFLFLASTTLLADQYVDSRSPDGKFALRVIREDKQPFQQSTAIIDLKSGNVILDLASNQVFDPQTKLIWSTDSQWVAYWSRTDDETRSSTTRVFMRNDAGFEEIKLPALPSPKLLGAPSASEKQSVRLKPLRWSEPGVLDLESEVISQSGWRGALQISLQLDRQQQAKILKAEPERLSILDYYLLLPDKTFEAPAQDWLENATTLDKENGYMSVSGDGAQPSFEVALFRYRDGRPLLALCEGELEGDPNVSLDFFELGGDRRMHKVARKIFPIGDFWHSEDKNNSKYADFQFELPQHGRTIIVRSLKTKKILHRVAWNGEKFIEQK